MTGENMGRKGFPRREGSDTDTGQHDLLTDCCKPDSSGNQPIRTGLHADIRKGFFLILK